MARHLIVRGIGTGKWLAWARAQMANLRETTGLWAFERLSRVAGAAVRLRWAGDEEWIYITALGERIFGFTANRSNVIGLREVFGGVIDHPFGFEPAPAFRTVRGPAPVSGRRILIAKGEGASGVSPLAYTAYDSLDGGTTMRPLPVSFPAYSVAFLSPAYGGPVFVDDAAVGTRYLLSYTITEQLPTLYYSEDAGRTWNSRSMDFFPGAGPPGPGVGDRMFAVPIAVGRNKLLSIAGWLDPAAPLVGGVMVPNKRLVIRSLDGGANWSTVAATGLIDHLNTPGLFLVPSGGAAATFAVGKLVAFGKNKVLFSVMRDDGAAIYSYTSLNAGDTWTGPTTVLTDVAGDLHFATRSDPLVIGNDSAVFRFTANGSAETHIIRTLDSGTSWQHLPPIAPGAPPSYFGIPEIYSRSVDPLKAVLMIPGVDAGATYLYVSRDSGDSWTKGPKLTTGGALGTTNAFFHLGLLHRPQPADIGATGLYSAD